MYSVIVMQHAMVSLEKDDCMGKFLRARSWPYRRDRKETLLTANLFFLDLHDLYTSAPLQSETCYTILSTFYNAAISREVLKELLFSFVVCLTDLMICYRNFVDHVSMCGNFLNSCEFSGV